MGRLRGGEAVPVRTAMRDAYGCDLDLLPGGCSIPMGNVFAETVPEAEIMLIGVEEPYA